MPWNSLNVKILHEEGLVYTQCGPGGFTKQQALEDIEKKLLGSIEVFDKGQEALEVWRQAVMQDSSSILYGDLLFTAHYYDDTRLDKVSTAALLATAAFVYTYFDRLDLYASRDVEAQKKFFAEHPEASRMRPLVRHISSDGRITDFPPIPYILGAAG